MTDNGGELRARAFRDTVQELGPEHRFIRSGRPRTNGCVEGFQGRFTRSAGSRPLPALFSPDVRLSART
ncbi:MAG: hypothetical protein PVI57_04330 [Gemmatimonadota bacterium]